jgi:ABC-2 type transport system ATP-binding protein
MEHVELFCKKLVVLLKGKSVISGYLKDIKEQYRRKNILIKADISKKELQKAEGVLEVIEKADEFEVKIVDNTKIDDVFKVISKSKNVTKFVVEEPSLNEIFISKVGETYEK